MKSNSHEAAIMKGFDVHFKKALHANLRAVLFHVNNNPEMITGVVKNIDETIESDVLWKYLPGEGDFVFLGTSQRKADKYIMNVYDGTILKSGNRIFGLPEDIKKDEKYRKIFGDRNF